MFKFRALFGVKFQKTKETGESENKRNKSRNIIVEATVKKEHGKGAENAESEEEEKNLFDEVEMWTEIVKV